MDIKLKIWRQSGPDQAGFFENHQVKANEHMSFLEMLDVLNEELLAAGKEPVAFDHDCREGICGACSMTLDGQAHGPLRGTTVCQLHMREYSDGAEIVVEPFRARAFPVVKDLVVDRGAFDRIQRAGGYVSVSTGSAPDANSLPIGKETVDEAFDYAACIGCGACVAACPNASAMLFTASKLAHLAILPQGAVERRARVRNMVRAMDSEGFGGCTNHGECSAYCPKRIPFDAIEMLNREFIRASLARD